MKAFIKKEKWEEFKKDYVKYGFSFAVFPDKFYTKPIDRFLVILYIFQLMVQMCRFVHIVAIKSIEMIV